MYTGHTVVTKRVRLQPYSSIRGFINAHLSIVLIPASHLQLLYSVTVGSAPSRWFRQPSLHMCYFPLWPPYASLASCLVYLPVDLYDRSRLPCSPHPVSTLHVLPRPSHAMYPPITFLVTCVPAALPPVALPAAPIYFIISWFVRAYQLTVGMGGLFGGARLSLFSLFIKQFPGSS